MDNVNGSVFNNEDQKEIWRTIISVSDNVDAADEFVESFLEDDDSYNKAETDKDKFRIKLDFVKDIFGVKRIFITPGETASISVEEREYRVLLSTLISRRFGF